MTLSTAKPNKETAKDASSGRRVTVQSSSLDELIGAHPDALRAIFEAGMATDPSELGEAPTGRILALSSGSTFFLLMRAALRSLPGGVPFWTGKRFDHGGNSGQNIVLGKPVLRFRAEVGPSLLDGKPALKLTYDEAAYKNPWPMSAVLDELRTVGQGVAIGPVFFRNDSVQAPRIWFGLQASP